MVDVPRPRLVPRLLSEKRLFFHLPSEYPRDIMGHGLPKQQKSSQDLLSFKAGFQGNAVTGESLHKKASLRDSMPMP